LLHQPQLFKQVLMITRNSADIDHQLHAIQL